MVDVVDAATRSRMMSGIRSKNTRIEVFVRKALFARGFRYRLHSKHLPGKPDLVLPKHRAVVLLHGCFWHGHPCSFFKWPATRREFWETKICGTRKRDREQISSLRSLGWRVALIWECAVRRAMRRPNQLLNPLVEWLNSENVYMELPAADSPDVFSEHSHPD